MRQSGILMHISSLPSPYGIGTMGKSAFEFVDFLKTSGQKCWQLLPVNPTGYGNSPYQGLSTFAGNPYLIDLDLLVEDGLLKQSEIDKYDWGKDPKKVDFGAMFFNREKVLLCAYKRFKKNHDKDFEKFCKKEKWWLDDFALFMALKENHNYRPWNEWEEGLKLRKAKAIKEAKEKYQETIDFHKFVQYEFTKQWTKLRKYAKDNEIKIIGDIPIYVPYDSADVWANPSNYQLDENLDPIKVAGCPPDAFAKTGQLWGNPIYDWKKMKEDKFSWWVKRLSKNAECFDVIRIDHFRGLESYWAIPYGDKTAEFGKWVKGPGKAFVNTIKKELPDVEFIAEDLGFLTPAVKKLQLDSGFPGMKILEFGFDNTKKNDYTPDCYTENCVCYTGTHDNETLIQWSKRIAPKCIRFTRKYLKLTETDDLCEAIIKAGINSKADLFMVQMQDYLKLGEEARMNTPSTLDPKNWVWRMKKGANTKALSKRLYKLTKEAGRI